MQLAARRAMLAARSRKDTAMPRKLNLVVLTLGCALATAWAPAQALPAPAAAPAPVLELQPNYTPAMRKLRDAAQHLRESIQAMAQKAPGPERDLAIAQANEALLTTQRAMLALPPQLRAHGTVDEAGYGESVKTLMKAADTLRDSIHAMARQPAGPGRDQAIRDANRALLDTQVAMVNAYDNGGLPQQTTQTRRMGANGHCVPLGPMRGCQ
jgi:hypothetical protein